MKTIDNNRPTFIRENIRWLSGGFLLTLFSSFGQTFFIGLFLVRFAGPVMSPLGRWL
ncbi:hypothetical protein [Afipia felis]|uniref:hypothetical protein n=1 Tax=Afipia felis TaxID=1035 RepID=UPI001AEC6198|nr:hypothetical protein [Afipia felis]